MERPTLPDDLLAAFAQLDSADALALLLDDLLTPAELKSVRERWEIVKLLASGRSQRAVRDALGVSITTVSRGASQYRYGGGGFNAAFTAIAGAGLPDPRHPARRQAPQADSPREPNP